MSAGNHETISERGAEARISSPSNPDALEVVEGFEHNALEGWVPELASDEDLRNALETAFDYRGDITLTLKDGSKLEGYLFDRRSGPTLSSSFIRIIPNDSDEKRSIAYSEITSLAFSGRDTAAGRSWEAWVRKYWEKRTLPTTS